MVWNYIKAGASWTGGQIKTTLDNVADSTTQTYDIATGADDSYDNVSRRQVLESTGALLLGYETAKEVPEVAEEHDPELKWQIGPVGDAGGYQGDDAQNDDSGKNNANNSQDGNSSGSGSKDDPTGSIEKDYRKFVEGEAEENINQMVGYAEQQAEKDISVAEVSDELKAYDENRLGFETDALERWNYNLEDRSPEDYAISMSNENGFNDEMRRDLKALAEAYED